MLIINTNDIETINEFEYKKSELEYKQKKKGSYDIDDFVMVRTTNFLSSNLILKALCKVPFVINTNNIAHGAIYNILREINNVNVYNESEYEPFKLLVNQYSPLSTQYRSTIHFTLNGLVSSHSKGSFDNQNFIIIDKLSQHLGKDDFRSIRMEDTFVHEEFQLSDQAIILINKNNYPRLISENPWLETFQNIVLFEGDEKIATQIVLTKLGIVPENIETHSAEYTERTSMHQNFFQQVTEKFGIEETKHYYSKEYQQDDEKNLKLWEIYDAKFYNDLFTYFKIDEKRKKEMTDYLLSYRISRTKQEKLLKEFILEIGLENYQKFVLQYNKNILKYISEYIYPTNDEILAAGEINLKDERNKIL